MLLKMILASSADIGAPNELVEESDAVDIVREDDPDDPGGVIGARTFTGTGCPKNYSMSNRQRGKKRKKLITSILLHSPLPAKELVRFQRTMYGECIPSHC